MLGRKVAEAEVTEDGTYANDLQDQQLKTVEGTLLEKLENQDLSVQHVIPIYPRPYFRGQNGGVYVRDISPDGEVDEHVIYHHDVYVTQRLIDAEEGESVVCKIHLPQDGVREFVVPLTAVTSREEFRKKMAVQGVALPQINDLMQYMITWVNELQATSTAVTARRQFGWVDENMDAFVIGDKEIYADRIEPVSYTHLTLPTTD